jgi:hypothetical protein
MVMSPYQYAGEEDNLKKGNNPLKLWNKSNTLKQPTLIKNLFMKKVRVD